ncbi:MAG: hypothetical protein DI637_05630 [Citromicrobium sp.]|nr:MAG: hypothetical protein DI637_05630 [Citromicrobium sp.]
MGSERNLQNKRVWVMAKGYAPDEGGMQTYAEGVAQAYARAGAEVTVFTQTSAGPRRERTSGVDVIDVGSKSGMKAFTSLVAAVRTEKTAKGAPQLFHGTTWRTSVIPMCLGMRYFVTFHGREFMGGGALVTAIMKRVVRDAELVVAVSAYSAEKLQRRLNAECVPVVAHNGPSNDELGNFTETPGGEPPLLFSLCRLEPRKNIAACLRACATLKELGVPFRYVIAGRGPELARLADMVVDLGLREEVELLGFVPDCDARRLHSEADIFLHPQIEIAEGRDFEGFGIVIADAMRSGTAVIVGQEGGAVELVEDSVSGLVVDGRNESALADAIEVLLRDTEKRQSIAAAGRRRARELFTWDRHLATILDALPDRSPA